MSSTESLIDVQLVRHPVGAVPFEPFPQPAGAEVVFFGRTRSEHHPEHQALAHLEYHAYEPLALSVLESLAAEAARRFGCLAVRVHHAIGPVAPGAASVVIQTVCGHRDEAFSAGRFLIDELKRSAPIWKREVWADGTTWADGQPVEVAEDSA